MSDVLSDAQMYLSEPDETVLTAALRNKDDIPILMDVVGADEVSTPVSQEMHLKNLLSIDKGASQPEAQTPHAPPVHEKAVEAAVSPKPATHFKYEPPDTKKTEFHYEPPEESVKVVTEAVTKTVHQATEKVAAAPQASTKQDQSQVIAAAIRSVLERRLPTLVAEVMTEISKRKGQ